VIDSSGNYNYLLNKDVNLIRQSYPNPTTSIGLPYYYALFGSQYSNINELSMILGPTPDQNYAVELHYFYYPPTIVQGQISTFNIINAGSAYVTGTYQDVYLTGGSGTGAIATIVVGSGNTITSVTITNGGNFYVVGDVLSANTTTIGGGSGTGFQISITALTNARGTSWLGDNYDPVLFYGAMREAMIFQKQEVEVIKEYEDKYNEAINQLKRLGDGLERGDAYRNGQTRLTYNKL